MKKILTISVSSALLLLGSLSWGQAMVPTKSRPFTIGAGTQKTARNSILHISIQDAKPKSGICPYYVRSLQYIQSLQVLNVEVYQESCLNDGYGFSQGDALWVVPPSLLTKGSTISVLVNDSKAGALVFDDSIQAFSVKGD